MPQSQISLAQSNVLADLDIEQLPENLKKEGSDWFAVFNPRARRVLDVDLIHNLPHQSVVCCVRFSIDGRFVATGCNRSAQIFDVETGHPIAHLQDGSLPEDGDLYIRSVCFSPSGLYLATGAEDKVIRVSLRFAYYSKKLLILYLGLGYQQPPDQAPVHRSRARHLLARLRSQRQDYRLWQWRSKRTPVGSREERAGRKFLNRGRRHYCCHLSRQPFRRCWFSRQERPRMGYC